MLFCSCWRIPRAFVARVGEVDGLIVGVGCHGCIVIGGDVGGWGAEVNGVIGRISRERSEGGWGLLKVCCWG